MPQDAQYLCPGDGLTISRSVHLGRLANLYPACRECEHRADAGSLVKGPFLQVAAAPRAAPSDPFGDEGLDGWVPHPIDFRVVRKFAQAAGTTFRAADGAAAYSSRNEAAQPAVVLGCDGRPLACELLAAASEGLRLAGCKVVEVEALTAPALTLAVRELTAAGGLLIGNPRGLPHAVGVRVWSRGGMPASAGGTLDAIRRQFEAGAPRPTRRAGGLARHVARTSYLAHFSGLFHALRPLAFVLDTTSPALKEYVGRLTAATACRVLAPRSQQAAAGNEASGTTAGSQHAIRAAQGLRDVQSQRLAWMAQQVPAESADFGIWIDGDGERVGLVDQHGRIVASDRLLATLARLELAGGTDAVVVVEPTTSPRALAALEAAGIRSTVSAPLAESMFQSLEQSRATLGGGPGGRFWFSTPSPSPDALVLLAWLLAQLSRSDRPLSKVLDDARV